MFDFNGNGLCDPDEVFGCMYRLPRTTTLSDYGRRQLQFGGLCGGRRAVWFDGNNDGVVGSGDLLQLLTGLETCTSSLRRSHPYPL